MAKKASFACDEEDETLYMIATINLDTSIVNQANILIKVGKMANFKKTNGEVVAN